MERKSVNQKTRKFSMENKTFRIESERMNGRRKFGKFFSFSIFLIFTMSAESSYARRREKLARLCSYRLCSVCRQPRKIQFLHHLDSNLGRLSQWRKTLVASVLVRWKAMFLWKNFHCFSFRFLAFSMTSPIFSFELSTFKSTLVCFHEKTFSKTKSGK